MKKWIVVIIVLLLISLPYIYAAIAPVGGMVFEGFLLNPKDGNTYLAKMTEGAQGSWLFTLPFSAEKGQGTPLFLFYIFLGHLAGLLHLPMIWMFHIARILGAGFLLWSLFRFGKWLFPDSTKQSDAFFLLASIGSGLGWLFYAFGGLTSDFWVAEAYPFLSMFANPHFPIGLGLMLWILILASRREVRSLITLAGLTILLSILLPFGVLMVGLILGVHWLWESVSGAAWRIPWEIVAALPGAAWVGAQYLITIHDPMLSIWNQQNVTPAPVIWDWIVSFSPALILTFFALNKNKADSIPQPWKMMLIWVAAATILQVIPLSLQRRFLLGFYLPLAAFAVQAIFLFSVKVRKWLWPATVIISIPTNLVLAAMGLFVARTTPVELYMTPAENGAYSWIAQNTPNDSLILSGFESGLRIPALTGRRVIYGHEYETIHAAENKKAVEDYFANPLSESSQAWLKASNVDYILVGSEERAMLKSTTTFPGNVVFQDGEVTLYKLSKP